MNYGLPALPPCPPSPDDEGALRLVQDLATASPAQEPAKAARGAEILAVLGAYSPYLAGLARRDPTGFAAMVAEGPDAVLERLWPTLTPQATSGLSHDSLMQHLRRAKATVALAAAVGDLAFAWPVMRTTGALSRLAMAALSSAAANQLRAAARMGEITLADEDDPERDSGLVILGMGKLGADELNYSSDIDLIVFFDSEIARPTGKRSPTDTFVRITKGIVKLLQERTKDGYVFRTDLQLRPDPGAMPVAISTDAAEIYYQSLGQNWERAAMIKARPVAGDIAAGRDFLARIRPFVWRRHLDFAAVKDIQRMKERIRDYHGHGAIKVEGQDVKLGTGGIREVEFFVQVQQLISGGREPQLREAGTLAMLDRLAVMGRLPEDDRRILTEAYCFLRHLEHRLQMVEDEQTHSIPDDSAAIPRLARFMGYGDEAEFRRVLLGHLGAVAQRFAGLFGGEAEAEPAGALPAGEEAIAAYLAAAGFKDGTRGAALISGWQVGRYRCFRHERARALVERLTPVLIAAMARTAAPDTALLLFDQFLSRLPAGVQLFSLLDANHNLLDLVAEIMGAAPLLAETLTRRPRLLDAVVVGEALRPITEAEALKRDMDLALCDVTDYQDLLDAVRRWTADRRFAIGVQLLRGLSSQQEAARALTLVADAVIERLVGAVQSQFALSHGAIPGGGFAVLGFGKLGGSELTVTSDLDLVFLCDIPEGATGSDGPKPLTPGLYYTRLGQRLIAALSALTAEGSLYEVDIALRPGGNAGALVTTLGAFETYYRGDAWTWEHMALTRARLVAADGAGFAGAVGALLDRLRRAPRPAARVLADAAAMRGRMDRDRPGRNAFDLKLGPGGLVDIEFTAQALLLTCPPATGAPWPTDTKGMIAHLRHAGAMTAEDAGDLVAALDLEAALSAMIRLTAGDGFEPDAAPESLKGLLAREAGVGAFAAVEAKLEQVRPRIRDIFTRLVGDPAATPNDESRGTGGLVLEED